MKESTETSYVGIFHEKQKQILEILEEMPDGYDQGELRSDVLAFVTANFLYSMSEMLEKRAPSTTFDEYRQFLTKQLMERVEQYIDGIKLIQSRKPSNSMKR